MATRRQYVAWCIWQPKPQDLFRSQLSNLNSTIDHWIPVPRNFIYCPDLVLRLLGEQLSGFWRLSILPCTTEESSSDSWKKRL